MSAGVWPFVFWPDSLWTDVLNFREGVGHVYTSRTLLIAFTRQPMGTMHPWPLVLTTYTPMLPFTLFSRHRHSSLERPLPPHRGPLRVWVRLTFPPLPSLCGQQEMHATNASSWF